MKETGKRVMIVAGGSGGIGRAVCRILAARGEVIVAAGTNEERLRELSRELRRFSPSSFPLRADLGYPEAWSDLVQTVENRFDRIDALINCVGILVPGPFDAIPAADLERVTRTNFLSFLYGTRAVLPVMIRAGKGAIVNVGSLGGIVPMPFEALYSATKFAVRGFTLSLGEELRGTGIHVSLVAPGPVRTRMLDAEARDDRSAISFLTPPMEPEAVAASIVRAIDHPRPEIVLPAISGNLGRGLTLFPRLFSRFFRTVRRRGEKRMRSYRGQSMHSPERLEGRGAAS